MFKENMSKIWKSDNSQTVYVDYTPWTTKVVPATKPPGSQKIGDIECYRINDDTEEKIFEWCLANGVDFCSNVDQSKIPTEGKYCVITASDNVINILKANPPIIQTNQIEISAELPKSNLALTTPENIFVENFLEIRKKLPPQYISVKDFLEVLEAFSENFIIIDKRRRIINEYEIDYAKSDHSFLGGDLYKITLRLQKINSQKK